jgi:hypothetical protein
LAQRFRHRPTFGLRLRSGVENSLPTKLRAFVGNNEVAEFDDAIGVVRQR